MSKANDLKRVDSGIDVQIESGGSESSRHPHVSITTSVSSSASSTTTTVVSDEEAASSRCVRIRRFLRPLNFLVREPTAKWITWTFVMLLVYASLWAYFPHQMSPNENGFQTVVTILCCITAEVLVEKIPTPKGFPPIPALLASLCMGLLLRNVPSPVNIAAGIEPETSAKLRELSLTVILTAAGLEIDPEAMKKVKYAVLRLAFTPCVFETTAYGLLAHFLLGFPYAWSFMMGFMISAVSPAVVVPSLIVVQQKNFGVKKGVPSLVMAASGIDDILAIAGFTVMLGVNIPIGIEKDIIVGDSWGIPKDVNTSISTVSPSTPPPPEFNIGLKVGGAILEVVVGAIAGVVFGLVLAHFPPKTMQYRTFCRGAILLMNGILWVFGTGIWGIEGAGAISALLMSFVAASIWEPKEREVLAHGWEHMWKVFQPILFGLTGAMVDVTTFDAETVGYGFVCIIVALIARLTIAAIVPFGLNLNKKEKAFVATSWIPKGTVQAALGSAALDLALKEDDMTPGHDNRVRWGEQILVLAVLATLLTAPIGAVLISYLGPKLLHHDGENNDGDAEKGASTTSSPTMTTKRGNDNKAYRYDDVDSAVVSECDSIEIKDFHNNHHHLNNNHHHHHHHLTEGDHMEGIKEEDDDSMTKTGF